MVTNSPITRKSTKEPVKTNRAGKAGCFRRTCGDLSACFLFLYAELRVALARPAFPAPSHWRGMNAQNPGSGCRGKVEACSRVPDALRHAPGDAKHRPVCRGAEPGPNVDPGSAAHHAAVAAYCAASGERGLVL